MSFQLHLGAEIGQFWRIENLDLGDLPDTLFKKKKNEKCDIQKKFENRDISTQSQYFSLILGQVAVLMYIRSPESLSSNGQL